MSDCFHWHAFSKNFERAARTAGFSPSVLTDTCAGPLLAWNRPGDGKHVYLSAGIHGDEAAGPLALLELMRDGFFAAGPNWSLCPALNPTGLASGRRENAEGMDLNRDYWSKNTREVAAHTAWFCSRPLPGLFLSLHEDWESKGFYLYEINRGEDRPERARRILDAVRPWFPPEPGPQIDDHTPRQPGWIFHAAEADEPENWPEAIFLSKQGCPLSFTFETPSTAVLDSRVAAHCAAVRAACHDLTDEIIKS